MRLKSCFGCFSLQTGMIAIGSMSLVSAILSAIFFIPRMDEISTDFRHDLLPQFAMKALVTGALIYVVVNGAMAGLMIYGAQTKKPAYVFPWLAFSTTDFTVWSSIILEGIVTVPLMFPIKWFFVLLAISSVYLSMQFYVWLVVYSFHKQIIVEKSCVTVPVTDVENLDQLKTGYHDV